jgi:macrolide transport system ATP-binding/permease protein
MENNDLSEPNQNELDVSDESPIIELDKACRYYSTGDIEVKALDNVSLKIMRGEFVAIMGASGSGKSTMMNIIGCLDKPTGGFYRVAGIDVNTLNQDELATLRRETFGFVFQRFNLLSTATAVANVEIPAMYAGEDISVRQERALKILGSLGLADRAGHRPNELSGGQQQRVSIARALMNDADVILADEPTGALDSHSGEEVLKLLEELHAEGRTIILITHDAKVAAHAERRIDITDGHIQSDVQQNNSTATDKSHIKQQVKQPTLFNARHVSVFVQFRESIKIAIRSLRDNIFRTALTLLGIVIGVGAVVVMLAVGEGSQKEILTRINAMGADILFIRPGAPGVRTRGGEIATLVAEDAQAIAELPNVMAASPERNNRTTMRYQQNDYRTQVRAVGPEYALATHWEMDKGVFINQEDMDRFQSVVVLGSTIIKNLFEEGEDPMGKFVLIGGNLFEVIGTLKPRGASSFGSHMDDIAIIPLTTGFMRLFGRQQYISSISVRVENPDIVSGTESAITDLLLSRHGTMDFNTRNTASLLETVQDTQQTFSLLLGSVAAISLLVGGIGVMNIMLVSVSERTREIGLRMAVGARQSDIMIQFNTEALTVGALGGLLGVIIGLAVALILERSGLSIGITPEPAMIAFTCSLLVGLVFGYLPARKAARLDPVIALATD